MNHILHRTSYSGLRVFSACLLSFLLIMMPFVQLTAAASYRSGVRNESSEGSDQGSVGRTQSSQTKGASAASENLFVNPPVTKAAALPLAPNVTATKTDNRNPGTDPAMAAPGDTITYTVTISNTGTTDATGVTFNDVIDAHTTLIPASLNAQPIALDDSFNVIGNVQIQVADGGSDLLANDCDPDVTGGPCTNTGLTITTLAGDNSAPFAGTSTQGGNVTASTNDGSFQYNPAPGFTGTDTFTYTASDAGGKTDTATVTLTVGNGTASPGTNVIWFINPSAPAGGDGRLTKPFNCYTGTTVPVTGPTCFSAAAPDDPGDIIFLFSGAHTGGYTLLNNQKLVGAAATDTLVTITGFTVPTHSDALPATGGVSPTMTTSAASTNAVNLGQGNTLRGFTVGNTTGAKIFGNNFGTLTAGKLASPDMILSGTGQALNLTTGTFAATSAFTSIATSSSGTQGIMLTGIAGTVAFGSTTVSGSTSQGILVGTTTADINFGNTSVSGGTDGISFQNNSSGTRTIGTLSVSNNSAIGFSHAVGGGNVTVTGATTIPAAAQTAPAGTAIDIQGLATGTSVSFAATTINKGNAGTAVNLGAIATPNVGNVTFNSLSITTSNGSGLIGTANTGSVTVTTNAGSIAATGGPAINITKAGAPASPITLNFTTVSSTNSPTQGVNLDRVSGNMTNTTTTITNSTGNGIFVQNTSAGGTMNFGNTSVTGTGNANVDATGTGVFLGGASSGNAGNVTFNDFDINPDANERALQGINNTGTITSSSGDVQATGNVTLDIVGASAAARTPLAMTLNNLDSSNSSGIGVNLNFVSGNFTVNDATLATSISNPTGIGIQVQNTGAGTVNFGNTNVASNGGTGVALGTAGNGNTGAITFADLDITPDSGQRGLHAIQNTGAITIGTGSTVATTNNTAVEITGVSSGSRTPLNVQFTSINTTGGATAANGILLQNTSATGAPGGFRVLGSGGACDAVTTTCTGGRITNTTGVDGATGGSGLYMDTVDKVVLTRMRIDTHTNFAVRGLTVTGFTMDTCLVDGANGNSNAADEGSIIFDGLFGTAGASTAALITGSTIKGGHEDNVRVINTNGTLELTITASTIRETNQGNGVGSDNVNIRTHGSANINAHVTNSTFALTNGDHIQTIADEQSTLTIVATGNTLTGGAPFALGQGITISGGTATPVDSTEVVRFNISNNTMSGTIQGGAININEGSGNGNWQGQISTNTIGTIGSACSGATQSSGIRLENHSKGSLTGLVTNNIVNQTCGAGGGIVLSAGDNTASGLGNGPLNATVTGNTVDVAAVTPASFDHGIVLCGGCGVSNNTNLVCLDLKNNTSEGSHAVGSSGFAYRIRQRFSQTVRLPGYGGANNDNTAVANYFIARPNVAIPGDGGTYSISNTVGIGAPNGPGGGFVNTPGGAQCTQPIVPSGPVTFTESSLGSLDIPAQLEAAATTNVTPNQVAPRFMWSEIPIIIMNQPSADSADKDEADKAEKAKEEDAKDNGETVTPTAAQTKDNSETVTPTAADADSQIKQKSVQQTTNKTRKPSSPARIEQPEPRKHHATSDVKTPRAAAEQKSAVRNHVAAARAMTAPMAGETIGPIIIGTLRPGDSVTITFQATVNNAPNLTLLNFPPGPRVSNQGSVSGSNFGTVLTDDTDVIGAANPTETLIDLFNTSTSVISSLNPSESGDAVTFTATVNETPVQGTADPTGTVQFLDGVTPLTCTEGGVNGIRPVAGGTAACTTSTLSSAVHTINANYSGDGNFDASSGNVSQTVNACTTNPVVTKIADTNDGTCDGDCSLREAIATVCSGNTITFNTAGAFATPQTITLTLGQLSVGRNVTIDGPDAAGNHVTVSGNSASRVFSINSGKTVTIRELSIIGGNSAGSGGGIFNDHGILTLINMTVSGNTAPAGGGISVDGATSGSASLTISNSTISGNTSTTSGGGIYSLGTGGAATLIITNSTISGNNADLHGGGLALSATTSTLTNVTVTNNRADNNNDGSGSGGGLVIIAGVSTALRNTIVAGNFNEDGAIDARDDVNGALDAASLNNLIGDDTGMTGITNGVNGNQVGSGASPIDAMLGPLANNGGPTQTHSLLSTSTAVDAGDNTTATSAGLTTDQRGTGFPRIADSADANATATVDIGAFELHPSIEDIPDKSTAEDTGFNFNFNIGDDTGALITSVTATSGNTTLVPNANLIVTGSGGTRNLAITPAADANSPADGTATITVTVTATNGQTATDTFVLTVTEVNDTPDAINDTLTAVDEDSGLRIIPFTDLLTNDTNKGAANESGQTLNVTGVSNPVGGTVAINGTNVEFTPTANFSGTASFDYTATDNGTTNAISDPKSDTATASFTVTQINDPPSFTKGADPTVNEDAGAQTIVGWATSISQGAGGETGQTLTFNITPAGTTGNLSFASGPAINSTTGTLTYTTNADTNGTATFDVTLSDNGSNVPPNSNTSGVQSFTITVTAVDDAPTFQILSNPPAVNEDGGAQTVNSFATNFQPGPVTATDENTQTLVGYTITAAGSTGNLAFTSGPSIDNAGTLTYTPSANTNGTATFNAVATDSGSGVAPNVNQSAPVAFTITVNAVNDEPSFTAGPNQSVVISAGAQTVPGWATNIMAGPAAATDETGQVLTFNVSVSGTTGTLTFVTPPAVSSTGTLTYNATNGTSGTATVDVFLTDNGSNVAPNDNTSPTQTFTITVGAASVSVQDAKVAEPSSGTTDMVFTVSLNAPAPIGGASVDFTTADEPAGPGKAVSGGCGGFDYTATSGTVSFAAGQQVKSINVPICSDGSAEPDETFLVNLSNPVNAVIADGSATGTITGNTAGTFLISELRTSGPGGLGDDFVELYNNTDTPLTVAASDASAGYGLYKMGSDCNATPVLIGTIPNGTVIPARGHYLFVGSQYSLKDYGGTNAAFRDALLTSDIESDRNVAVFSTANIASISSVNKLDAVGFGLNTGSNCNLLREGSTLTPVLGSITEHSFFRKLCDFVGGVGCSTPGTAKDTNDNATDFLLADTAGTNFGPGQQHLGAPGPENKVSPIKRDPAINVVLLDATASSASPPNRLRDLNADAANASDSGTLSVRRRVVNNTGANVTRLRFRIVEFTTFPSPGGGVADLRARSSTNVTVSGINDAATCFAATGSNTTPCMVTVKGTTLEQPPTQPNNVGGGYNATLAEGTITTLTPLAPGASTHVQFLLGVKTTGTFRFLIIVEALP